MMKRSGEVVENSPVQQMMAGNPNCNWWSVINTRHHHHHQLQQQQPSSPNNNNNFFTSSSSLPLPSWHHQDLPPHSWTQLLMDGGCQLEEGNINNNNKNKLMSWEDDDMEQVNVGVVDPIKQETTSVNNYGYANTSDEFQATKPPSAFAASFWPHPILPPPNSSPKSTITTFSTTNINNLLDFSTTHYHATNSLPLPDPSPQCNSGGATKKARVQASTTTQSQSSFKVRKEKLGDRITTLHQLVSPFGKTDTASVLLEAIGYIRFLQSQIEALSLPYLGNASPNMRHQVQQPVQGENNCIFPEDPGQLLNENCLKRKAAGNKMQDSKEDGKKDLRSRGLCLVPVSCTMQVGSENGADYWAPALGGGFR